MGTRSGETGEYGKKKEQAVRQQDPVALASPRGDRQARSFQPRSERGRNHRPRKAVTVLAQRSTPFLRQSGNPCGGKCGKLPQGAGAPGTRLSDPHTRLKPESSRPRGNSGRPPTAAHRLTLDRMQCVAEQNSKSFLVHSLVLAVCNLNPLVIPSATCPGGLESFRRHLGLIPERLDTYLPKWCRLL